MAIDIELEQVDINQCATDNSLFANTHRCRKPSTRVSSWELFSLRHPAENCKGRSQTEVSPGKPGVAFALSSTRNVAPCGARRRKSVVLRHDTSALTVDLTDPEGVG